MYKNKGRKKDVTFNKEYEKIDEKFNKYEKFYFRRFLIRS